VRIRLPYLFFFLVLIFLDQVTKLVVAAHFLEGESLNLIGDYLRLTYVRNPGAAFSLSFGGPQIMFAMTIFVIALLVYLYVKGSVHPQTVGGKIALLLVFAGAVGNLIDRCRMFEVIDFIEMGIGHYRWPVYNFADIFITFGTILLFLSYATGREPSGEIHPPVSE